MSVEDGISLDQSQADPDLPVEAAIHLLPDPIPGLDQDPVQGLIQSHVPGLNQDPVQDLRDPVQDPVLDPVKSSQKFTSP